MPDTPLFFYPGKLIAGEKAELPDETARHISQVLRMSAGEEIELTDGNGLLAHVRISEISKKRVAVVAGQVEVKTEPEPQMQLAIAFTKNASRNEWLLEKATELGVRRIIPLSTERSNRERIRPERWNAILVSAMLQSKQSWLPVLEAPVALNSFLKGIAGPVFIAHCMDQPEGAQKRIPIGSALKKGENAVILIGPEGDFSPSEVILAEAAGAIPVSLGSNRLRTETAALAAITHFYLLNHASSD